MGDKTLRQFIIDELDFEPSIDSANIGVAVENGVVTLSGHVATYAEKIAAERTVQRIKGVKAIAQEIEVRYPDQAKRSDDEIAQRQGRKRLGNLIGHGPMAISKARGGVRCPQTVRDTWGHQFDRDQAARSGVRYSAKDHGFLKAQCRSGSGFASWWILTR